jgi:hypothetical protein
MPDGTKGVTLVSITFFDAHFHIIDPRFPLEENQGFLPDAFTCQDYLKRTKKWNVIGGAVVSGSFQGFDQSYLMEALKTLGPTFVGVTQLPHDISEEDIIWLHECGVRAVRINVQRGGFESLSRLEYVANRLFELVGWHVELYVDSRFLSELFSLLVRLPAVSIDHLGLSEEGFPLLLNLMKKGIRVKATPGRSVPVHRILKQNFFRKFFIKCVKDDIEIGILKRSLGSCGRKIGSKHQCVRINLAYRANGFFHTKVHSPKPC